MILPSGQSLIWAFLNCHLFRIMASVSGLVEPIEISGKKFFKSITREPFYIKGVDYQPGDSSKVSYESDPLSEPNTCARDIILFQELGINTVRIYSVNPELNHDKCVSMLAAAGIYVILDVNSPLPNQHLNRYEPWTTYNSDYLEHVFKVIDQFSGYNNTLGFFAGNEVVNDKRSAQYSPIFIKAVLGDMKSYINKNVARRIPVGYSAADDLDYRYSLSSYLECAEDLSSDMSVDFYGVNSYQWCGEQTMQSSGYDILVEAYKNYSKPVFLSEFGCNRVLPRVFDEIQALYSKDMYTTFSGGLVYEFTQEGNGYGLVDIDSEGHARILEDFQALKSQYTVVKMPSRTDFEEATEHEQMSALSDHGNLQPLCKDRYENLNIKGKITKGLAASLVKNGVSVNKGHYVTLTDQDMATTFAIYNVDGSDWKGSKKIERLQSLEHTEDILDHREDTTKTSKSCISNIPPLSFVILLSFTLFLIFRSI